MESTTRYKISKSLKKAKRRAIVPDTEGNPVSIGNKVIKKSELHRGRVEIDPNGKTIIKLTPRINKQHSTGSSTGIYKPSDPDTYTLYKFNRDTGKWVKKVINNPVDPDEGDFLDSLESGYVRVEKDGVIDNYFVNSIGESNSVLSGDNPFIRDSKEYTMESLVKTKLITPEQRVQILSRLQKNPHRGLLLLRKFIGALAEGVLLEYQSGSEVYLVS